jgi:cation transport regulator ChaB
MPYATDADLPESVKALPRHARKIYRAAFNSAAGDGKDDEAAAKIAWSAVDGKYEKRADGQWRRRQAQKMTLADLAEIAQEETSMSDLNLFIPLSKVDLVAREVWGWAAEEAPDKSKEIMDYAASKPRFLSWSDAIQKASGGKSRGNVRAMHNTVAAGKVIHLDPRDDVKKVWVGVKVVDDAEWQKVQEGVYTGFSVGGSYGKRWPDLTDPTLTRYEAIPAELSLVDNPAMYGATFEAVKADGTSEMRKFMGSHGANETLNEVSGEWRAQFAPSKSGVLEQGGWVVEVFDNHAIVDKGGQKYAYPFVRNEDGSFTWGVPIKVKLEYVTDDTGTLPTIKAMVPLDLAKADYPWDRCMADQQKRYGSEERAKKVCGKIKAKYGKYLEGAELQKAYAAIEQELGFSRRGGDPVTQTLQKAAANPTKLVELAQALRNEAEAGADFETADLLSSAIRLIMQASGNPSGEAEQPAESEAADAAESGDEAMGEGEMAEGEMMEEGSAETEGTEETPPEEEETYKAAANALKPLVGALAKVAQDQGLKKQMEGLAKADDLSKLAGDMAKVVVAFEALQKRVEEIAATPIDNGPALREVRLPLAGGVSLEELSKMVASIEDPSARAALGQQLSMLQIRQAQTQPQQVIK